MTSIRRQLTVSLLAATMAAFGAAGFILYRSVSRELVEQFDVGLAAQARGLAMLVEFNPRSGGVDFDYSGKVMPEYEGGDDPHYFALWISNRDTAKTSTTLHGEELPRRAGSLTEPEVWDMTLADGRAGRALGISLSPRVDDDDEDGDDEGDTEDDEDDAGVAVGDTPGADATQTPTQATPDMPLLTVVVARSRAELDARLASLVTWLGLAGAVVLVLVGWLVTVGVRRGLLPIGALGQEVGAIDASSLSRRVGAEGIPEELVPFADKLNELLERLAASFDKERRMTAAMAHELRTPIAELRTATDVARRWPDDEALAVTAISTAGDVALQMSRSVEAIMRYCRLEAGQVRPELTTVLLHELVDELWSVHVRQATERGLSFSNDVPTDAAIGSDRGLLSIVLGNLLHNAASFASGGVIRVELGSAGERLELSVANATDHLGLQDLGHLDEPFWRKDAARTDGLHSGLGLTLVRSVADVLGYQARFELHDGQFRATVAIPATAALTSPPRQSAAAGSGAGRIT